MVFFELARRPQFVLIPFSESVPFILHSLAPHQTQELSWAVSALPSPFHSCKEDNKSESKACDEKAMQLYLQIFPTA
jgi:hypothetical protein